MQDFASVELVIRVGEIVVKDGPTVVEIPPGSGPGTVNDAFFRFVIDMGAPGPDRGKGGKYLLLPPEYDGDIPAGYFVARSPSYIMQRRELTCSGHVTQMPT